MAIDTTAIQQNNISASLPTTGNTDSTFLAQQVSMPLDSTIVLNDSLMISANDTTSLHAEITWPLSQDHFFQENKRNTESSQFLLIVVFFMWFLLALLRTLYPKKIGKLFKSGFNTAYASSLFRNRTSEKNRGIFILNLIFLGSMSVFLYHVLTPFFFLYNTFYQFTVIFLVTTCYHFIRIGVYHFIGLISETQELSDEYIFNMQTYSRILGLFLLPTVFVMSFPHLSNSYFLDFIGFGIIIFSLIALIIRTSQILMGSGVSSFYLILYLCTLEILPFLYMLKLLLM
ncbi:MAG: DUF4271 domain-containing protein [Mangrovibacterium sp.]